MECKEIEKMKNKDRESPQYEKLFDGSEKEKLEIAKHFIENMKMRESLLKNKEKGNQISRFIIAKPVISPQAWFGPCCLT